MCQYQAGEEWSSRLFLEGYMAYGSQPRWTVRTADTQVDLDVGESMNGADSAATNSLKIQTNKLKPLDLAIPELEPVTMSEVGTKLDLARAYMDMGDPEGARSILEEVVQEGSASQKQEASRLIESLPG